MLHNDGAENFELAVAPVDATSHEQWQPLLPHDPPSGSRTSTRSPATSSSASAATGSPSCA